MELLTQLVNQLLAAVPPELLRGIAVGIPTVPSVWAFIEHVLPPNSSATTNHLTNILSNMVIYVGLHASNTVTFGTSWHGYLAAGIFSILGYGSTLAFHKGVQRFAPALTKPSDGGQ